jgi:glycosyltransferase involved in cell wall biosynthesis
MRIAYIAYPTSLTLASANAIQTWTTLRELRRSAPETLVIIPRWLREPSRFSEVGALHLPRPAIGKLSRLYRSTLWYYAERSAFAAMSAAVVWWQRRRGQPIDAVYIREVIGAGWWAAVWGPLLGIPVVYEAHDLESWNPSRAKERWAQPLLNLLDRLALGRSAAVASLTEDFRGLLQRIGWRDQDSVAVIPDAFDQTLYQPGDRAAARQQLGLPAAAPIIVYAGMTFSYRGLERLIDAFAGLRAEHPDALLLFVGGRPAEIERFQAQAAGLRLGDAVRFLGPQPQQATPAYLHAADVLVIPDTVTDVTASPLKLFEYLAVGRAVVLPNIPALAEVLPTEIGYYFQRGDTPALQAALSAALGDPRRSQREAAGHAVVQEHTYAARAERILAVCRKVTGQPD